MSKVNRAFWLQREAHERKWIAKHNMVDAEFVLQTSSGEAESGLKRWIQMVVVRYHLLSWLVHCYRPGLLQRNAKLEYY